MKISTLLLLTPTPGTASSPLFNVRGRLRVVDGRFQNDDGWWPWWSVSDFAAVEYVRTGQQLLIAKRFAAYAAQARTMVRIFGNIGGSLGPVDHRQPGYWEALHRTVNLANSYGMYVELCCYGAAEFIQDDDEYRRLTIQYAQFALDREGVFIRIANEPYKNGWTNADDPRLLELANLTAGILGHKDFAIGDAGDGNIPVLQTTLQHCNVALVHPDRKESHDDRWRRWVDHIKASAEMKEQLRADAAFVFDEPMGAGARQEARRDDDPDALLAAHLVAQFCNCGYTYHWIPEENAFHPDQLPGLSGFARLARYLPITPDWKFSNTIPVEAITWSGKVGKTRNTLSGNKAWTVAYGEADWDSRLWTPGYTPTDVLSGPRIRVTTHNM